MLQREAVACSPTTRATMLRGPARRIMRFAMPAALSTLWIDRNPPPRLLRVSPIATGDEVILQQPQ